eukprot:6201598-Pleurochrysis_carterae.AAC.4
MLERVQVSTVTRFKMQISATTRTVCLVSLCKSTHCSHLHDYMSTWVELETVIPQSSGFIG